jgi:ankyrin repeat protein
MLLINQTTPLHKAAEYGHTKVAQHLLCSGADATLANNKMFTPLQFAVSEGRKEFASLLLSHQQDM